MKHRFLVDENIIYHAIRGVDKNNNEDKTAANFILYLAWNCHKLTLDKELRKRYMSHLGAMQGESNTKPIPNFNLVLELISMNKDKLITDFSEIPSLLNENGIPPKDIHIVRAAKYFNAVIVTADQGLLDAVNKLDSLKALGLKALTPKDAIELAKDS